MLPTSYLLTSDRLALQQCAGVRTWPFAAQDAMECAQSYRLRPDSECIRRISGIMRGGGGLFVFNDTIEGPRPPAVNFTLADESEGCSPSAVALTGKQNIL